MADMIMDGGLFTWAVLLWAAGLFAFIARAFLTRRNPRGLWAGVATMVLLGACGTAMGFFQAGAVPDVELTLVASIAAIPFVFATGLGTLASIAIGLVQRQTV